jgi:hypothetical protein
VTAFTCCPSSARTDRRLQQLNAFRNADRLGTILVRLQSLSISALSLMPPPHIFRNRLLYSQADKNTINTAPQAQLLFVAPPHCVFFRFLPRRSYSYLHHGRSSACLDSYIFCARLFK